MMDHDPARLAAPGARRVLSAWRSWPRFPACHLGAPGLTPFKIVSEYVISGILLAAVGCLCLRRRRLDGEVFAYRVGHLLKVMAVYLTCRARVVAGLQRADLGGRGPRRRIDVLLHVAGGRVWIVMSEWLLRSFSISSLMLPMPGR